MACPDLQTLINTITSNGQFNLDDRGVLLAMAGALSLSQGGVSAETVVASAAQFLAYDDRMIKLAIAKKLCP